MMDKLKLKIPPLAWFGLCAVLMWLLAQGLPDEPNTAVWVIGGMVGMIGLVIAVSAVWAVRRADTTLNPFVPGETVKIVNRGIYGKSRNPIYLALLLGLTAWALLLSSLFAWAVVPLFIWLITYFQIQPEERVLAEKFGREYLDYKAKVRRWI